MTDPVPELAAEIAGPTDQPSCYSRVGVISAMETAGSRRVQLDISGDAWVNRLQDTMLQVGDRVSVLQQGPVMLVLGRLEGLDAFTPIGGILPYAGSAAPTNWLLCDGSAVSRTVYAGLFTICGTTYGSGDGSHTFNVPDLRNRIPMGAGATYTRGSTSTGSVTLSSGNLPGHTHGFSDTTDSQGSHGHSLSGSVGSTGSHSHGVGNQGTRSDILAGGGTTTAATGGGNTGSDGGHSHSMSGSADSAGSHSHSVSGTTGSTGSGTAFTPTGPYQAVSYIIRAI
jgi:microcystin-dependent protein